MKKLLLLTACFFIVSVNGQCWKHLAAGEYHTIAVQDNGTLWAWGTNFNGQLGDGSVSQTAIPVQIGTTADWEAVGAASMHSIALKTDGTLWAWGENGQGQLGNGTLESSTSPVQVGTDSDWQFFDCGYSHTVAIKTDGSMWSWGANESAQLGDGTNSMQNTPIQIGAAYTWQSVSAGYTHNAAIRSDGALCTWGYNQKGELGNTWTDPVYEPTQAGTATDWLIADAGNLYTAALKTDGSLWTWGSNESGELGIGQSDTESHTVPILVGSGNWIAIATTIGGMHAIKEDGTLWGWGTGNYGQVGDGTTDGSSVPLQLTTYNDWEMLVSGNNHVFALKEDRSLFGWGFNLFGQLGDGTFETQLTAPAQLATCNIAGIHIQENNGFVIYPNPVSDVVVLLNAGNMGVEQVNLTDCIGKTIMQYKGDMTQIAIEQLPSGFYFLEIRSGGNSFRYKFIKE